MNKSEKEEVVRGLSQALEKHVAVFAMDYRGLKVEEATELRRKVRDSGGGYRVVKNRLVLRGLEGTPFEPLGTHCRGMTGLAYTDSDAVGLAKCLDGFSKDVPALVFKGGMVLGKELDETQFKVLATLPGRDALLAKLLYVMRASIQNFLGVLQAPARDLVLVLRAAADKAKESSDS